MGKACVLCIVVSTFDSVHHLPQPLSSDSEVPVKGA